MRQGNGENKVRIYLSKKYTPRGEWAGRCTAALRFFGTQGTRVIQMKEQNIHWKGEVRGSYFLIFIPFHLSKGSRDFCPYLALMESVTALVHDGIFLAARLILL